MLQCVGGFSATWGFMSVVAALFYFFDINLFDGGPRSKAYVVVSLAMSVLNGVNATYHYCSADSRQDEPDEWHVFEGQEENEGQLSRASSTVSWSSVFLGVDNNDLEEGLVEGQTAGRRGGFCGCAVS